MKVDVKAAIAEAIGTAMLTLAVLLSLNLGSENFTTPVIASLTLALVVGTTGYISGAHVNPAITFALWANKKVSGATAIVYVFAQFIGAGLALLIASMVTDITFDIEVENTLAVGMAELIGTAILGYGVASVVYQNAKNALTPFVVGASLYLGIFVASFNSLGILNPAVAVGLGAFGLFYLLAPFVGATVGVWIHKMIATEK